MSALDDVIAQAQEHEMPWTRDPNREPQKWGIHQVDTPPWNRLFGPVHARGGVSGVILQGGKVLRRWGEPERADHTFSVAKTYLVLLAGVAHARGLLLDPDQPIAELLPGIGFDSEHNRAISWTHLFTQTSEWEGSCFGIPDQVDRYRTLAFDPKPVTGVKGSARPLQPPGSYWEYNDVRINQLALALLHLFQEPLPEVFQQAILRPLGAGANFSWVGYDNSWVDLPASSSRPAQRLQSVPGGTHWGGGVSISADDQAQIGQLMLQEGQWKVQGKMQSLVPASWVHRMHQPCALAPFYGWLTWLNPGGKNFPGPSADSYFMVGAGGNTVWIDPQTQTVVVSRWLDPGYFPTFVAQLASALKVA